MIMSEDDSDRLLVRLFGSDLQTAMMRFTLYGAAVVAVLATIFAIAT